MVQVFQTGELKEPISQLMRFFFSEVKLTKVMRVCHSGILGSACPMPVSSEREKNWLKISCNDLAQLITSYNFLSPGGTESSQKSSVPSNLS